MAKTAHGLGPTGEELFTKARSEQTGLLQSYVCQGSSPLQHHQCFCHLHRSERMHRSEASISQAGTKPLQHPQSPPQESYNTLSHLHRSERMHRSQPIISHLASRELTARPQPAALRPPPIAKRPRMEENETSRAFEEQNERDRTDE